MKKWQILEFDGKPYYAFVPEGDSPLPDEDIPGQVDEQLEEEVEGQELEEEVEEMEYDNISIEVKEECQFEREEYDSLDEKYNVESILNGNVEEIEELKGTIKPITLNGISETVDDKTVGDLYQVKVQGSMVTIEKLASNPEVDAKPSGSIVQTIEKLASNLEVDTKASGSMVTIEKLASNPEVDTEASGSMVIIEKLASNSEVDTEASEDQTEDENDDEGEVEYLEEAMVDVPSVPSSNNATPRKMPSPKKTSSEIVKCKLCSEIFDTVLAFRKHVAWSHKKKICIKEDGAYICAVCGFRTPKKSSFIAHLDRKHDTWSRKRPSATKFPCSACGFVCRSKHSLQSHFTRKHTDNYEHQCNFCTKKFKVKGDLTNHIRFHHKEKPIKCDVCGKQCLNSGSLYVHQKWAHYKPKYECHICKRRMVTQENLDQHLLTQHEQRDKIVCAECGKTFTKKDSFKRHMVVHTGCKPHSCMICSKPFARRSQLRQHLLIHTGKRPFVCDICGKAFTQKPGLICHRKTHPGPHPPLPVMPIADIVKEFTDGYVQESKGCKKENFDEDM